MVSDFFEFPEPEPEPKEPHRRAQPPWMSAPRGSLPGVIAVELVLARAPRPAAGIELTRADVDAQPLIEAATRSARIFEDLGGGGGSISITSTGNSLD